MMANPIELILYLVNDNKYKMLGTVVQQHAQRTMLSRQQQMEMNEDSEKHPHGNASCSPSIGAALFALKNRTLLANSAG